MITVSDIYNVSGDNFVAAPNNNQNNILILADLPKGVFAGKNVSVNLSANLRVNASANANVTSVITDLSDSELMSIFKDVPSSTIKRSVLEKGVGVLTMFTTSGLTKSNSQALQLVKQGGAYVNNVRVNDSRMVLSLKHLASESMLVLRSGKKKYHLIKVSN